MAVPARKEISALKKWRGLAMLRSEVFMSVKVIVPA